MRISGKSTEYSPVIKVNDKKYVVNWFKEDITEKEKVLKGGKLVDTGKTVSTGYSYWNTAVFNHKPSANEIQKFVFDEINDKVKSMILLNFKWNGFDVYLSKENQMNYKSFYDLAFQTKGASLPVTLKFEKNGKAEYFTFDDLDIFTDFYKGMVKHINNCLAYGWSLKDKFHKEDYTI
ncbi:MAG: hypothetical protein IJH34_06225 [Romboutsia sp.]|nr:hypothetical protein [Romboutsia sp.]